MHFHDFQSFPATFHFLKLHFNYTKDFSKFIKEKMIFFYFQFIYFKTIFKPKSDQCVELLRSRRFFRDQDRPYWLVSYFDVICVIRHHMTQMSQMTRMTSKCDISQFGRSWSLKKRLGLSNSTCTSDFGLIIFFK